MANPHKGKVEFEIDGKKYLLSFSANALAEMEIALGISMDEVRVLLLDEKRVRIAHWRTMFLCALQDNDENIDEKAARALFKQLDIADAINLIGKAYGVAFKGLAEIAQGAAASPPEAGPDASEQPTGPASSTPGVTSEEAKPNSGG